MMLAIAAAADGNGAPDEVIKPGSTWNYHDGPASPGAAWTAVDFDDSAWKSGPAILGYGDDDVATTVDSGGDSRHKNLTAWFRRTFELPDTTRTPVSLRIELLRDDGAVVYLNGEEVARSNMPDGPIDAATPAAATQNGADERLMRPFPLDGHALRPGRNVIAVEVHQSAPDSSDLAFDLRLAVDWEPGTWQWDAASAARARAASAPRSPAVVNVHDAAAIAAAQPADWRATAAAMRAAAESAYQEGDLATAARRHAASRWAAEFGGEAAPLAPALKQFLLAEEATDLSLDFFDLLSPKDNPRNVHAILNALFSAAPQAFAAYPRLAFAIAIVYDQAPPSGWPHGQVSPSLLPRQLPDPVEAFRFWCSADQRGKTLHALGKLQLEELKYVVDVPLPIDKLEAALSERARLNGISDLYSGIRYDTARLQQGVYNWPHASYDLADIREHGGICVDQAYFTTIVAKAHGVPAMLVSGAGQEGNHAWVGFLGRQRWDFDTGRYPESKFVTGTMFDPQTWEQPTDHEIAFLSERFRNSSKYRTSRIHARFAREFLAAGNAPRAEQSARAAITAESRNLEAWQTLLACLGARGAGADEREATLGDATRAFSRYADIETMFLEQLAASHAARNDTEEADKLRARIIRRNREDRPDLALAQARSELDALIRDKPVDDQLAHYKGAINRMEDAGLIAYQALTQPFLEHLVRNRELAAAREALRHTRRRLKASDAGQLNEALSQWEQRLSK